MGVVVAFIMIPSYLSSLHFTFKVCNAVDSDGAYSAGDSFVFGVVSVQDDGEFANYHGPACHSALEPMIVYDMHMSDPFPNGTNTTVNAGVYFYHYP